MDTNARDRGNGQGQSGMSPQGPYQGQGGYQSQFGQGVSQPSWQERGIQGGYNQGYGQGSHESQFRQGQFGQGGYGQGQFGQGGYDQGQFGQRQGQFGQGQPFGQGGYGQSQFGQGQPFGQGGYGQGQFGQGQPFGQFGQGQFGQGQFGQGQFGQGQGGYGQGQFGQGQFGGFESQRGHRQGEFQRGRWQREPMSAREIMTTNVKTVMPQNSLRDVAQIMKSERCGIVPVVDENRRLLGVVTDRDIVIRGLAEGKNLADLKIEDIMTDDVEAVTPDESIHDLIQLMGEKQIRRVPVVDRRDQLLGIISLSDLATRADYDEELQDALERISSKRSFWNNLFG